MTFITSNDRLTLSWRRPISYRNQSIDLRSKSMDWFLYDISLRHEKVKFVLQSWNPRQKLSVYLYGATQNYTSPGAIHITMIKVLKLKHTGSREVAAYSFNASRSSCVEVFCQKSVLKNLPKFWSCLRFFVPWLLQNFKNTCIVEYLQTAASVLWKSL